MMEFQVVACVALLVLNANAQPFPGAFPGRPHGWTPLDTNSPSRPGDAPNDTPMFPPNWKPLEVERRSPSDEPSNGEHNNGPVFPHPRISPITPRPNRPSGQQRRPTQMHRYQNDIMFPEIQYEHEPKYDYANALAKSMLFYEAQRSGKLPYNHRISWRADSAMDDGADAGVDLSGGYYDGGGFIKYGFPMAYTATVLSWGVIRYRRTYEKLGQLEHALNTIKWATDYFLKCKRGTTTFFAQVSDQSSDSSYRGKPEDMSYQRKSYFLTENRPGSTDDLKEKRSEVVAETAAALAAASIVFFETDPTYSEVLIDNSLDLYDFANKHRGDYQKSIKAVDAAYRSHSGYKDELAWAAAWIYRRTGLKTYLQRAKRIYKSSALGSMAKLFSWDDKKVGVQLLLAEITKSKTYKNSVKEFCDYCMPGGKSKHTEKGLLYVPVANYGPLRYAANAAFICHLASELDLRSNDYRLFALTQIDYILGSSGRSYVVGFGENPPTKYYHKASYCPDPPAQCPQLSENFDNARVLYGALVGGPSETDEYADRISIREQSSVALDYNAGFQSALAAVLDLHIFGIGDRPELDKPEDYSRKNDSDASTDEDGAKGRPTYNYALALQYSLEFYEAQKSGRLTADNRIPWRFDSALDDGKSTVGWDLSGGYYDGEDYVKYTFPLAFTITMLSWSLIEFGDAYHDSDSTSHVVDAITWGTDYLKKAHVRGQDIVISQVGDEYYEKDTWDRPESITINTTRPVKFISKEYKGSEVAAEMAAAFAAASFAFTNITDQDYRDNLIERAVELFEFANANRGTYSENSLSSTTGIYESSGYEDELAWAAMWIYKATQDAKYLNFAKNLYNTAELLTTPKTFSYDDKRNGMPMADEKMLHTKFNVQSYL